MAMFLTDAKRRHNHLEADMRVLPISHSIYMMCLHHSASQAAFLQRCRKQTSDQEWAAHAYSVMYSTPNGTAPTTSIEQLCMKRSLQATRCAYPYEALPV